MARWLAAFAAIPLALAFSGGLARGAVEPYAYYDLTPSHDTWATHDDGVVHGLEEILRVGIEPQQCVPGGWNPCTADGEECCVVDDGYNYCALPGQCAVTPPRWSAFRKFHGYIRFDLSGVTEGEVDSAFLSFKPIRTVAMMGGEVEVEVQRLKKIGQPEICAWDESVLDSNNFTTWSSLPQNVSVMADGRWRFDVTKAVRDWLTGDVDVAGTPIQPNCGFHLVEPNFGGVDAPLQRWVDFSSKEGTVPPLLTVRIALDLDGDGWFADCDEENPAIHPGATETCDGVDNDCDGTTDEEDCDGVDNDCDGTTDEGDPVTMCGPGRLCVAHVCLAACEDDCAAPNDLECRQGADGVWERWGCGYVDEDPCRDRYFASNCDEGDFCQFGYCSSNCIDLCEPEQEGTTACYHDSVDHWYLGTCGDWDSDGCLEWGDLRPCGPAATCTDGVCQGGCADACTTFGAAECVDDATVRICYDADGDGCIEWVDTETCAAPNAVCDAGLCVPVVLCEDPCSAGTTRCEAGAIFSCVSDPVSSCYGWDAGTACAWGCDAAGSGCADAPPGDVGQPDVQQPTDVLDSVDVARPPADVVTPPADVVTPLADVVTTQDAPSPPPDAPASADAAGPLPDGGLVLDGTAVADGGGGSGGSGGSGGCQGGSGSSGRAPAGPLGLLLAFLAIAVLRRRGSGRPFRTAAAAAAQPLTAPGPPEAPST